ncbi:MAG: hypothetical protein U0Y82_09985 [Thermoleophilia bacterium]
MTQLLAAARALHLLPTWLALQEEGWRQRRRNKLGTIGASPAELCGGHDERGAAGVLGMHTTRSRATNYRHIRALEVLGLLSRERLRGAPRRGPGAEVLYALLAYLITDHEARERDQWVRRSDRGQGRPSQRTADPSRGPPDIDALERDLIRLADQDAAELEHITGPQAARHWLTGR